MKNILRRNFIRQLIQKSALCAAALPFSGILLRSLSAQAAADTLAPLPPGATALSESDPVATAVGFRQHAKDIDFKKYPQRKKADAKNQFCQSCALFTPVSGGWGKCQMLTAGLVPVHGWCASWNKKS